MNPSKEFIAFINKAQKRKRKRMEEFRERFLKSQHV